MDSPVIEMHLRELNQLFDSLDHSPFHDKDLDRNAEEYIVESMRDLHSRSACTLVIHLENRANIPEEEAVVEKAVRIHFSRRSQSERRKLRQLLRRGFVSLCIGLTFLIGFYFLVQSVSGWVKSNPLGIPLREGLIIIGWVAMWKPLEIFLYDWWPILGERRLYDRLSRISVHILP